MAQVFAADDGSFHLLRAYPDSLVSLKLKECTNSTICDIFDKHNTSVSKRLAFPCLQDLHIGFADWSGDYLIRSGASELCFPELKRLVLKGDPEKVLWLLQSSTLPSHVESIALDLSRPIHGEMKSVRLPKTDRLILDLTIIDHEFTIDYTRVLATIGNVFEYDGTVVNTSLRLFTIATGLNYIGMGFGDLTDLYTCWGNDVTTLLQILANMQRLRTFYFVVDDPRPVSEVLDIDLDRHAGRVVPLKSNLQSLRTEYVAGIDDRNKAIHSALVKYLLLRLPQLTLYESRKTRFEEISEFIEQHVPRYPHLLRVRLAVDRNGTPLLPASR
ncbi:hypothetical protein GGF46_003645 [Coemansia sp. RSA 552]|nr:hypothetical protein GGF46_003645 [Coemansia sp. RSA 552]